MFVRQICAISADEHCSSLHQTSIQILKLLTLFRERGLWRGFARSLLLREGGIFINYSDEKKKPVKTEAMRKAEEAVREYKMSNRPYKFDEDSIASDVLGSYTGMSWDGGEPDQDADDL